MHCQTKASPRRVKIVTLGCAKNEVDSDRMRTLIDASPLFESVEEDQDCDVVIVNTCSFLMSAVEEGVECTLQLLEERLDDGVAVPVVMCGLHTVTLRKRDLRRDAEVAAFVPVSEEDGIVDVLARVCGVGEIGPQDAPVPEVVRTVRSATAYVKISDGCDRFCSSLRHTLHPRALLLARHADDSVRGAPPRAGRRARGRAHRPGHGASGVATCRGAPTLAALLREVARVMEPYGGWVRVLYLQPEGLTDELVETIRDVEQVVPYIDIPLQHSSQRVLRAMNRTGCTSEFLEMVARLRREVPGITLRTTGMAGFPGETDEDFDELCVFLDQAQFDLHRGVHVLPRGGDRGGRTCPARSTRT